VTQWKTYSVGDPSLEGTMGMTDLLQAAKRKIADPHIVIAYSDGEVRQEFTFGALLCRSQTMFRPDLWL